MDLLAQGKPNAVAVLQWNRASGFHVGDVYSNDFRDQWGLIHARFMHASFYDPHLLRPSRTGIDYLLPIFNNALGFDDLEALKTGLFDPSHLSVPFHSVNTDINKRIKYLEG